MSVSLSIYDYSRNPYPLSRTVFASRQYIQSLVLLGYIFIVFNKSLCFSRSWLSSLQSWLQAVESILITQPLNYYLHPYLYPTNSPVHTGLQL